MPLKTLLIEEGSTANDILFKFLYSNGYHSFRASNTAQARKCFQENNINLVILDLGDKEVLGSAIIKEFKPYLSKIYFIVISSIDSISTAVNTIKMGAFDYILKNEVTFKLLPAIDEIRLKLVEAIKLVGFDDQNLNDPFKDIIGVSTAISQAKNLAMKVANTNANVLLLGETGVGKDLFAEAIHKYSNRRGKPYVAINCAAINKDVLVSELFGYMPGAFTGAIKEKKGLFEVANKGTIFLDEIGEMSVDLQATLLRVLQSRNFIKLGDTKITNIDCRVIAATNIDIMESIGKQSFRQDLYYRLASFVIKIPSLRERDNDVDHLAKYYIEILATKLEVPMPKLESSFIRALNNYPWKGNVRELINVLERALIMSEGVLTASLLEENFQKSKSKFTNDKSLVNLEDEHIKAVFNDVNGNKREAARRLGISVSTLYRKLNFKQ